MMEKILQSNKLTHSKSQKKRDPNKLPTLPGRLSLYRLFIRPILFRFDAETVHSVMLFLARIFWAFPFLRTLTHKIFYQKITFTPIQVGPMEFRNPLGLAAGFDKNANLVPGIETLGFGFIELGTVTPKPQIGNPKPRLSRIPEKRAILHRMGFNNDGGEVLSITLKNIQESNHPITVPIGINIGKNKDTPNSIALRDYEILLSEFRDVVDYYTVNLSSPNTPDLRALQSVEFLNALGEKIKTLKIRQPVFIKLAPELEHQTLEKICNLCGNNKPFTGLILTNTISTDLGGLSGYPLHEKSLTMLRVARSILPDTVPIISVGGIETTADLIARIEAGASACQIYSTLIYQGPSAVRRILRGLQKTMTKLGYRQINDFRQMKLNRRA